MTPQEIENLKAENTKLKASNARYKSEANKAKDNLAKQVAAVTHAAKHGGTMIIPDHSPVEGTLKVTFTANKKKVTKTVQFRNGRKKVRLMKTGEVVSSEAIMALASGKELDEKTIAASPALNGMDKEEAINFITDLVKIGSTVLMEVEA